MLLHESDYIESTKKWFFSQLHSLHFVSKFCQIQVVIFILDEVLGKNNDLWIFSTIHVKGCVVHFIILYRKKSKVDKIHICCISKWTSIWLYSWSIDKIRQPSLHTFIIFNSAPQLNLLKLNPLPMQLSMVAICVVMVLLFCVCPFKYT